MFTRLFHPGDEGPFSTRDLSHQHEAPVAPGTGGFGRSAWDVFGSHRGQVGAAAEAAAQTAARLHQEHAGTVQSLAQQAQKHTLEAVEQVRAGAESLSMRMPKLPKADLDFLALQSAGFGAVGAVLERRRVEAYDAMFAMSSGLRSQLMLGLREMVKESMVSDPDMPRCARERIKTTVDRLWVDIVEYQEKLVQEAKDAVTGRAITSHEELADLGHHPVPGSPYWFRARILYHYLPFDRSLWGQVKDPLFLLFTALSLMPHLGLRVLFFSVILILILRGCPPDEYQLVSYILTFKGTQVFSSGVAMATMATVKYYICVHGDGTHSCDMDGPGGDQDMISSIIDFCGSSALVWIAFLCLPCSGTHGGSRDLDGALADYQDGGEMSDFTADGMSMTDGEGEGQSRCSCACCWRRCCRCCRRCMHKDAATRGGRLAQLLCWDLCSFVFSLVLLLSMAELDVSHARPGGRPSLGFNFTNLTTWEGTRYAILTDLKSWRFKVNFFMVRIFYAFLSLPYVIFIIPVLNTVLTHTSPTGYNLQGVCVPFMLNPMPKEKGA